jgi:hypothetical protein
MMVLLTVLGTARVVVFATTALGAPPFGGIVAFEGGSLQRRRSKFCETITVHFGAAAAFITAAPFGITTIFFFPTTFICFPAGRTQALEFLFFAASTLASVPTSGHGP